MGDILKIINEDTGLSVPFNEIALLKAIKSFDGRNKKDYDYYVDKWENLTGRRFDKKKHLELI